MVDCTAMAVDPTAAQAPASLQVALLEDPKCGLCGQHASRVKWANYKVVKSNGGESTTMLPIYDGCADCVITTHRVDPDKAFSVWVREHAVDNEVGKSVVTMTRIRKGEEKGKFQAQDARTAFNRTSI